MEVYDLSAGNWMNVEYMHDIRVDDTAILLLNGYVLMARGFTKLITIIYDFYHFD